MPVLDLILFVRALWAENLKLECKMGENDCKMLKTGLTKERSKNRRMKMIELTNRFIQNWKSTG